MYTISNAKKIQNSHSATLARSTCPKNVSVMSVSFQRRRVLCGKVGQADSGRFLGSVAGTRRGIAHQRPEGCEGDEQKPDLDMVDKGVSGRRCIERFAQLPRGGHATDPVAQATAQSYRKARSRSLRGPPGTQREAVACNTLGGHGHRGGQCGHGKKSAAETDQASAGKEHHA